MDRPEQSILETLRTVQFRLGRDGYDFEDVDKYLESVAVEAESVLEQLRAAGEQLLHATERIGQLEASLQRPGAEGDPEAFTGIADETLQQTFVLAQKFVEQTKRESEEEALEILIRAEERGRAVVAKAEERARQIAIDTEERLRGDVARLEAQRGRLATEIESMSKDLHEQRARLRECVAEVLKWTEEPLPASFPIAADPDRDGVADAERSHSPIESGLNVGSGLRPQQRRPARTHRSPGRKRPPSSHLDGGDLETE